MERADAGEPFAGMNLHERVEKIYVSERENIYSYLLYLGVPTHRAQELAQDAFLKLYLKMSKGEDIDDPRAWLYRVVHNLARRFHRREPVFDEIGPHIESLQTWTDPAGVLIEKERRLNLARAIRDLSPQQRNCLHLRSQGLRYRDIAKTIGISSSAVGEFLRRAVVRLKEAVGG